MSYRTTAALVKGVLAAGDDYGPRASGEEPDLTPYIRSANLIVNQIVRFGASRINSLMQSIVSDTATLAEIETWLAAHAHKMSDQPYSSKSTGGASGSFQGQTGMRLEATKYGQHALLLDYSGVLEALNKRAVAGGFWSGKAPSEQIAYEDRD